MSGDQSTSGRVGWGGAVVILTLAYIFGISLFSGHRIAAGGAILIAGVICGIMNRRTSSSTWTVNSVEACVIGMLMIGAGAVIGAS